MQLYEGMQGVKKIGTDMYVAPRSLLPPCVPCSLLPVIPHRCPLIFLTAALSGTWHLKSYFQTNTIQKSIFSHSQSLCCIATAGSTRSTQASSTQCVRLAACFCFYFCFCFVFILPVAVAVLVAMHLAVAVAVAASGCLSIMYRRLLNKRCVLCFAVY